jgi:hypothetical protein
MSSRWAALRARSAALEFAGKPPARALEAASFAFKQA